MEDPVKDAQAELMKAQAEILREAAATLKDMRRVALELYEQQKAQSAEFEKMKNGTAARETAVGN